MEGNNVRLWDHISLLSYPFCLCLEKFTRSTEMGIGCVWKQQRCKKYRYWLVVRRMVENGAPVLNLVLLQNKASYQALVDLQVLILEVLRGGHHLLCINYHLLPRLERRINIFKRVNRITLHFPSCFQHSSPMAPVIIWTHTLHLLLKGHCTLVQKNGC